MSLQEENISLSERPVAFVIFGLSGDLASRMLIPSIHALTCSTQFHPETLIIGVGRSQSTDETLLQKLEKGIRTFSRLDIENTENNQIYEPIERFFATYKIYSR